jgi:putative MATE family efflux protein
MLKSFTTHREFIPKLLTIASPIILQNLLQASLNFVDFFMIGRLEDSVNALAAVGIGVTVYFLFLMFVFSVAGGTSIFTAQYWGKKDVAHIRSYMGIGITFSAIASIIFTIVILLFPKELIMLYNKDPKVVELGVDYITIVGFSLFLTSLSITYSMVLRSTEHVIFPMVVSSIGIALNTLLNLLLIFGYLGFPRLEVRGAAIATLIARTLAFFILISFSYFRKHPIAAAFKDIFNYSKEMVKTFIKKWLPVFGQSMGWALGYNMYSIIYGNMGKEPFAAYQIACTIERVCLTLFIGLGTACAIMVGNRIGAGEEHKAKDYSKNFLFLAFIISLVIGTGLIMARGFLIGIYNLDDLTSGYLYNLLFVMACIMLLRVMNITFNTGILKAGGDTFFSMFIDMGGIWLIGVPIAAVAAFIIGLPIHYVMLLAATEELAKMIAAYIRFFSNKWINNLTRQTA